MMKKLLILLLLLPCIINAQVSLSNGVAASTSTKGFLTSTDWNTFNNKGSGTVTSIATGLGLSGGTITASGTLLVDTASASILSRQRAANTYLPLAGGTMTGSFTTVAMVLGGAMTGASGSISISGNISGNNIIGAGLLRAAAGSTIEWSGRSKMNSASDGAMTFFANNGTTYSSVQSLYDRFGSGSPESVVTAPVGAVYHRTDGGANTSIYVKESGSGNTGWVAK